MSSRALSLMRSALPQADPRDPSGISSELWIAHLGGSSVGKGDGNFDRNSIVDDDARHRLQTSTSTSSATSSSAFSALACLRHPFVRALADGSLPVESFRFYVAQGERKRERESWGMFRFRFSLFFLAEPPLSLPTFFLSLFSLSFRLPLPHRLLAGLRPRSRCCRFIRRHRGLRDPHRAPAEHRRGARAPPRLRGLVGRCPGSKRRR